MFQLVTFVYINTISKNARYMNVLQKTVHHTFSRKKEFRICTNFQPVTKCHVCTLVAIGVFLLKNNFDWNKFFLMKNMWWIAHLFYFFLIEFALRKVHFWVGAHERFEHFLFWKNGWKCSAHLSTAVAWREKKFKHFVFYKHFCLILGLLKSRI